VNRLNSIVSSWNGLWSMEPGKVSQPIRSLLEMLMSEKTPLSDPNAFVTWQSRGNKEADLRDVKWVGIALALVVILSTLRSVSQAAQLLDFSFVSVLIDVVLRTLPLSFAIFINFLIVSSNEWAKAWERGGWAPMSWVVVVLLIFLGSAWVSHWLGAWISPVTIPALGGGGGLQKWVYLLLLSTVKLFAQYWQVYGGNFFLAAVAVGVYGGWALKYKISVHFEQPEKESPKKDSENESPKNS
jgi:hypothetical protein